MRIKVCENYGDMSKKAAKIIACAVTLNPACVLGLATGSTPEGMYAELVNMYNRGDIDLSEITTFNLDEYYPISPENSQSYYYFMQKHLFSKVNVPAGNINIPNGAAEDAAAECEQYEKRIAAAGGIDLQILGIGQNGHIGFNEPDGRLKAATHLTSLTESTVAANSRFFKSADEVPKQALTMGIATIMRSKKIVLMASGKEKRAAIRELLNDSITTAVPATMLKAHPDVVLLCDREAYGD